MQEVLEKFMHYLKGPTKVYSGRIFREIPEEIPAGTFGVMRRRNF